jgi:hypothetical protein
MEATTQMMDQLMEYKNVMRREFLQMTPEEKKTTVRVPVIMAGTVYDIYCPVTDLLLTNPPSHASRFFAV